VKYLLARLGAYPQSGVLYEAPLGQAIPLLANVRLMEEVTIAQAYRTVVVITTVKILQLRPKEWSNVMKNCRKSQRGD
jgi:hypothetical protein